MTREQSGRAPLLVSSYRSEGPLVLLSRHIEGLIWKVFQEKMSRYILLVRRVFSMSQILVFPHQEVILAIQVLQYFLKPQEVYQSIAYSVVWLLQFYPYLDYIYINFNSIRNQIKLP